MKALRILAVLCFFLVLPTTKVISQATTGNYDLNLRFYAGGCFHEDLSGTITVQQLWNNNSYHEKAKGTLIGLTSGDDYSVTFEWTTSSHLNSNILTYGFNFPMMLFHKGKLFAIIHYSYRGVVLTKNLYSGPFIVDRTKYSIECK
jgi:hypothetical protein